MKELVVAALFGVAGLAVLFRPKNAVGLMVKSEKAWDAFNKRRKVRGEKYPSERVYGEVNQKSDGMYQAYVLEPWSSETGKRKKKLIGTFITEEAAENSIKSFKKWQGR